MPRDHVGPASADLYWGDFHKHMTGPGTEIGQLDDVVAAAAAHLDIVTVLCYPFTWSRQGADGGIRVESVGGDPAYDDWWEAIQDTAARHLDPGAFVTFPGYEWHGDRTRWGDHNVIDRTEGQPIEAFETLPDLYEELRERPALAIPHHTAYRVGSRGRDWTVYDAAISPVMEIYSSHGSSEGVGTPVGMAGNADMGPRTSGGTFQDALDRGHRVGVIAANDGPGLPGSWGNGLAGVWAEELTREAVWDAICNRRTYGVTGDRIRLWWTVDGEPMGSVVSPGSLDAEIGLDCPQPLDRIELVHDGRAVETYLHRPRAGGAATAFRQVVEFGWGPTPDYGAFEDVVCEWRGTIRLDGGRLRGVQPRFHGFGQSYESTGETLRFDCRTWRGTAADDILPEAERDAPRQGFVLSYEADRDATLQIELDGGQSFDIPLEAARERAHLFPLWGAARDRLAREFDLPAAALENRDAIYHIAPKVNVRPAYPRSECVARVTLELPPDPGAYYVRAAQVNGQYAWASPIWIAD